MVREAELMCDDHHCHSLVRERLHHVEHFTHKLHVERGRRLVEQHRLGTHHQRSRNGDALLLTA